MSATIERRLEKAARAFMTGDADLAGLTMHEQLRDELLRPDAEEGQEQAPVKPMLIFAARDLGRYGLTPIRQMSLAIVLRVNGLVPAGMSDPFDTLAAAIERRLDDSNLVTGMTSVSFGIHVMLARRQGGAQLQNMGLLRFKRYELDVRAVVSELTV